MELIRQAKYFKINNKVLKTINITIEKDYFCIYAKDRFKKVILENNIIFYSIYYDKYYYLLDKNFYIFGIIDIKNYTISITSSNKHLLLNIQDIEGFEINFNFRNMNMDILIPNNCISDNVKQAVINLSYDQDNMENLINFEVNKECTKKCQFWEVDDCKDFKGYKELILRIENIINLPGDDYTDGECLDLIAKHINNFKKMYNDNRN